MVLAEWKPSYQLMMEVLRPALADDNDKSRKRDESRRTIQQLQAKNECMYIVLAISMVVFDYVIKTFLFGTRSQKS